ncbi:efflux transporter outer membrane subunit [Cellvibrio sp. PSBB006]|uniref:efflux transporter outer membrane subunit n=1 Tax=Cellvibrio sp. PSBB006 TaxID=1987723 RepID=UPI0026F4530F|nr:efflux transporter outer membrane subunit [Cellvibrio sp. PSBB006]
MMINRIIKPLLCASSLLALAACSMAPHYERPDAPVALNETAQSEKMAADIGWRDFYRNQQLQTLIEQALENNRDLRVAALTVEQVRAQYRIQRAQLLPTLNATGSGTRQRVSEAISETGESYIAEQYAAGVGISAYELDLFGRVQSLKNAALEQYLATDQARKSTQLSLVAEVADAYFTWVSNTELLSLTENTLKARQDSYAMVKRRYDSGLASELDLSQAATALHSARVDAALYQRQLATSFTALEVLVGTSLDADNLQTVWNDEVMLADLPDAVTSEVLLQRPDILQAEYNLRSANANIGAARAAFFPRISLTGSYGNANPELDNLFDSGTRAWSFSPQITLPIFAWGANAANLDVARLQKDVNIAVYEKAIQTAFKEVRDSLQSQSTLDAQLEAQQDLVTASARSFELAELRYQRGVDSYLEVLDSQRSLNTAQQALITMRLAKSRNQLTLYKALGGGLQEHTADQETNQVSFIP